MARFYASISGVAKTPATRTGTPRSGAQGHVRGWDLGGRVEVGTGSNDANDHVTLTLTGGSNGPSNLGVQIIAAGGADRRTFVAHIGNLQITGTVGDSRVEVKLLDTGEVVYSS
ncbi:MAG: hypothetical protein WC538_21950 [Thermoanaerobaculia bacterium]|jgi:hypothetical protein